MRLLICLSLLFSGCMGRVVSMQVRYHPSGAVEVATQFDRGLYAR